MAGWPPSSRVRYWLMQLSLWGVFGLTLLLAQLLHRHYRHLQHVSLEEIQDVGAMRLRPPVGWERQILADRATFSEPADLGASRRALTVWHSYSPVFLSPMEFLLRSGQISILVGGPEPQGQRVLGGITIAGWPGVLIAETHPLDARQPNQGAGEKRLVACTVLPSLQVIGLELRGVGDINGADEDLVRRVAESISLAQAERPQYGDSIDLPEGIHVGMPVGFAKPDFVPALRDSRTLVLTQGPAWLAVDLTPSVFLPGDGADTFVAMLMRRDPRFLPGRVVLASKQTLRCERRDDAILPSVAYLRVGPDGRALLAEFRWSRPGSSTASDMQWVDGIWQSMTRTIEFVKLDAPISARVKNGEKGAAQLLGDPAGLLSEGDSGEFQWYHESLATKDSLMKVRYGGEGGLLKGQIEATRRPPLPNPVQEECAWSMQAPGGALAYEYTLNRAGPLGDFAQATHIANSTYRVTISEGEREMPTSVGKVPEGFVPGGVLPLALGRLGPEPLVLTTDAAPMAGVSASTTLMRLLVEPADGPPRRLMTEPPQMLRCWKVRINGASSSSRWYYDKDGRLHAISFDGQIHLSRIEQEPPQRPQTQPAE